jgi:hypothetical protein
MEGLSVAQLVLQKLMGIQSRHIPFGLSVRAAIEQLQTMNLTPDLILPCILQTG